MILERKKDDVIETLNDIYTLCRGNNDQEYLKQHKEETQDFCFQYPLLCVPD